MQGRDCVQGRDVDDRFREQAFQRWYRFGKLLRRPPLRRDEGIGLDSTSGTRVGSSNAGSVKDITDTGDTRVGSVSSSGES